MTDHRKIGLAENESCDDSFRRVVKLGGSLLADESTPARLRMFLELLPEAPTLIVVGGGAMVDAVRELNQVKAINSEAAHWLSIRLMDETAGVVASWFNDWHCTDDFRDACAVGVFKPNRWLSGNAVRDLLPKNWKITSDSIAALVARTLTASELILLKNCSIESQDLTVLGRCGVVDEGLESWVPENVLVSVVQLSAAVDVGYGRDAS